MKPSSCSVAYSEGDHSRCLDSIQYRQLISVVGFCMISETSWQNFNARPSCDAEIAQRRFILILVYDLHWRFTAPSSFGQEVPVWHWRIGSGHEDRLLLKISIIRSSETSPIREEWGILDGGVVMQSRSAGLS